jgi:hypothetical protein
MRDTALRMALQRRLGSRFHQGLWDYLLDRGFVDEVLGRGERPRSTRGRGAQDSHCRRPISRAPGAGSSPREPKLGQERAWALSQLVAAHAHHDPDVIAFRHKYLGDALVEWADLITWITARVELDGEPTTDITIVLPASAISDPDADQLHISPPLERVRPARVAPVCLTTPFQETTGFDAWPSRPMARSTAFEV